MGGGIMFIMCTFGRIAFWITVGKIVANRNWTNWDQILIFVPGTQLDFDLSSYNLDICIGPQMPEKSITFQKKSITFRGSRYIKNSSLPFFWSLSKTTLAFPYASCFGAVVFWGAATSGCAFTINCNCTVNFTSLKFLEQNFKI